MRPRRKSRDLGFRYQEALRRLALVWVVLCATVATSQTALPDYEIKAAFLYHFTQFIEWPSQNTDRLFVICVAGDPALSASLDELIRGKYVGERAIRVKQIKQPGDTHACHLVFLGSSLNAKAPTYLAAVHALEVLTVGEEPGFRDHGGMIELFQQDNRMRFDINEQALRGAHLRASSRLLRLARRVEPARPIGAP